MKTGDAKPWVYRSSRSYDCQAAEDAQRTHIEELTEATPKKQNHGGPGRHHQAFFVAHRRYIAAHHRQQLH